MITLKLRFKMSKKGQYVRFKNYENKKKITVYDLCRFWKYFSARN